MTIGIENIHLHIKHEVGCYWNERNCQLTSDEIQFKLKVDDSKYMFLFNLK